MQVRQVRHHLGLPVCKMLVVRDEETKGGFCRGSAGKLVRDMQPYICTSCNQLESETLYEKFMAVTVERVCGLPV